MKKVLLLNLMPNKIETENHFKNIFDNLNHKIDITFLRMETYDSKNISKSYLLKNYEIANNISFDNFDRFICTGSPVETMPFEAVSYWKELINIFKSIEYYDIKSYYICWGAQAVLYYRYGIKKVSLKNKKFGIYDYKISGINPDNFYFSNNKITIPVSRYTESIGQQIKDHPSLNVLFDSQEQGICMLENNLLNEVYNFNHFEYDTMTLKNEYLRDVKKNIPIQIPENYFPNNDLSRLPKNNWTKNAIMFFNNWFVDKN
mgnify:FL=1